MTLRSLFQDWRANRRRRQAAKWLVRMRGDAAGAYAEAFQRWLGAESENKPVYDRLAALWDEATVLRASRLSGTNAPKFSPMAWWTVGGALVGASLLIVITPLAPWSAPLRSAWARVTALHTRVGEIRTVRLADGSTVILDTDSALAVNVSSTVRHLALLKGRARFDVYHDAAHPFVVSAGDGLIIARGTLFDVALTGPDLVAVTLVRGAVDIERSDRTSVGQPVARMSPGQKAAFGPRINHLALKPAVIAEETWPEGVLTFDKAPLAEVVGAANRYTVRKIELEDPALGDVAVTGVFHVGEADHLAQTLAAALDLQLQNGDDGRLILHRPG